MTTLPVSVVFASSISISVSGLVGVVSCRGVSSVGVGIGIIVASSSISSRGISSSSISIGGVRIVTVLISLALALVSCCSITSGGGGGGSGGGRRIEGRGDQSYSFKLVLSSVRKKMCMRRKHAPWMALAPSLPPAAPAA